MVEIVSVDLIDKDLEEYLLSYLKNTIFHVTKQKSYELIMGDGEIKNNRDNVFPLNTSSEHSFGRKMGYVCLFDLRDKDRKIIDDTLSRYYFLHPTWFMEYYEDRTESNLAYFILEKKFHHIVIGNEAAKYSLDQFVPKTECWIKDRIPLDYIEKVILAKIVRSVPKNSFYYALHLLSLERQNMIRENNND